MEKEGKGECLKCRKDTDLRYGLCEDCHKAMEEKFGKRPEGNPIDWPQEIGYRCPKGHSDLEWSEYKGHIWCNKCGIDYHYAHDCFLVKYDYNPKFLENEDKPVIVDWAGPNWDESGNETCDIPIEQCPKTIIRQMVLNTVDTLMNDEEAMQRLANWGSVSYELWFNYGWKPIDAFSNKELVEELKKRAKEKGIMLKTLIKDSKEEEK